MLCYLLARVPVTHIPEEVQMPEFVNPFSGVVPDRKMTKQELIRAIRLNLAAEHEAIHLYDGACRGYRFIR